jgi:CHAT domain-containing protein
MKLSQLPVKILLSCIWIFLATKTVHSQSGNMSDITLPSPDAMIGETGSDGETPPTEEVATEEEAPSTDEVTAEEETPPTEEVTAEEETTPTDEVTAEEETPPTEEVTAEEETTPTDEVTAEEETTPTEEVTAEEEAPPTEEVTAEEETPSTEEVAAEEEVSPTEEVTAEEEVPPTEEVTAEEITGGTDSSNSADNLTENTAEDIVQEVQANSTETNSDLETLDTASIGSEVLETEPATLGETIEANKLAESNDIVKKLFAEADRREIQKSQETEKESRQEEDKTTEERNSEPALGQLDRVAYETQFQEAPNDLAILMQEEFQLTQLIGSSGIELYGSVPSVKDISRRLAQLTQQTGKKPAFINISLQENQLESFVVLPEQEQTNINTLSPKAATIRKTVKNTSRKEIIDLATEFRREIGDVRKLNQNEYKNSAQELYRVLIKPIEAELEANDIDVLVFSMDSGLRLLPVAALYDGKQFLVEKYALGMVPSFGLTDTRYVSPNKASILAMGASEFKEQSALPTMPIELKTIVSNPRRGESFLNEQFTIRNFVAQNSRQEPFSIIHLGTHAEFKAGDLGDSYIQFHDERLKIPQLQKLSDRLGWNTSDTPIELLVLSACETALGDKDAELGFAGLAVQAGVKSTLASLWYVSDLGTLAMMGEFYDQLGGTLNKAEALRQTQLAMLRGNVKIDTQQVKLSNGKDLALPSDFPEGTLTLNHPYFWSSFALIGNWN